MTFSNEVKPITFDLGHLKLHGVESGSENFPTLLCLHGWLDNADSFKPLIPFLNNRRVIAIDLPGHGLSSHRSVDAHYHFVDWVYDLLQLFEFNNWPAIDIVGHSMGGMIASAFSAAFPDKVKSLTLIDSVGFLTAESNKTTEQMNKGMLSRLKNSSLYANKHHKKKSKNVHATLDSAIKARVAVSDLSYENAEIIVKRGIEKKAEGYAWRADSRLRNLSPNRLTLKQADQIISDINCPVQLIHSMKGLDMVSKGIKHFSPLFKQLTVIKLSGGHHFHMELPEETATLINNFLKNNVY